MKRKDGRFWAGLALAAAVFVIGFALLGADGTYPANDPRPKGCVDCHKAGTPDTRFSVTIPKMKLASGKAHVDISKIVKEVPTGCAMCHKAGAAAGDLGAVIHKQHFVPATNTYIATYKGDCVACHQLNTTSGDMKAKTAAANW